jgi:hypothetical protein
VVAVRSSDYRGGQGGPAVGSDKVVQRGGDDGGRGWRGWSRRGATRVKRRPMRQHA